MDTHHNSPEKLFTALEKNVHGLVVRAHRVTKQKLIIKARVPQESMNQWLIVMNNLLVVEKTSEWTADISKHYFNNEADKLMYSWRIIFQVRKPDKDSIEAYLHEVISTVSGSALARQEVNEASILAGPDRNSLVRGKGAQGVLGARVGPMLKS